MRCCKHGQLVIIGGVAEGGADRLYSLSNLEFDTH